MVDIEEAKENFSKGVENISPKEIKKLKESITKPTKKGKDGKCYICGYESELAGIQEHHIVPERLNGSETRTLCGTCHLEIEGFYAEKECTSEQEFKTAFKEFKSMKRNESPYYKDS